MGRHYGGVDPDRHDRILILYRVHGGLSLSLGVPDEARRVPAHNRVSDSTLFWSTGEPSSTLNSKWAFSRHHPEHGSWRARSPPSHVIHPVHRAPTTGSASPTNFLNRVCSGDEPWRHSGQRAQSSGLMRHHQDPSQGHAT